MLKPNTAAAEWHLDLLPLNGTTSYWMLRMLWYAAISSTGRAHHEIHKQPSQMLTLSDNVQAIIGNGIAC